MLEALREEICRLHMELPKNNLVTWTSGNVSGRDPDTGYVVIKPSGIRYEDLRPEHMVIVTVDGQVDIAVSPGDVVCASMSEQRARFVRLAGAGYYYESVLRRLGWADRPEVP